jgi:hypothetical protein
MMLVVEDGQRAEIGLQGDWQRMKERERADEKHVSLGISGPVASSARRRSSR